MKSKKSVPVLATMTSALLTNSAKHKRVNVTKSTMVGTITDNVFPYFNVSRKLMVGLESTHSSSLR